MSMFVASCFLSVVLVSPSSISAQAAREVIDAYFGFPGYVASLDSRQISNDEASFRQNVRQRLMDIFDQPLLTEKLRAMAAANRESEDFPILLRQIGDAQVSAMDAPISSDSIAFVSASAHVRQVFSEDSGLANIDNLFVMFPITNMTARAAHERLRSEAVPESLSWIVRSEKRYVFRLVERGAKWRIAEIWERTTASTLSIERPQ